MIWLMGILFACMGLICFRISFVIICDDLDKVPLWGHVIERIRLVGWLLFSMLIANLCMLQAFNCLLPANIKPHTETCDAWQPKPHCITEEHP